MKNPFLLIVTSPISSNFASVADSVSDSVTFSLISFVSIKSDLADFIPEFVCVIWSNLLLSFKYI